MARTRAEDFEDKQRSILENAATVFARVGMDKASMSLIAREAGLSKALLYHYYSSKDALIFAIIHTHLDSLDTALETVDNPDQPAETRLRQLVGTVLEQYRGADDAHKVQLNAISVLSDDQRREITEIERRIVRRFSNVLREINPALADPARPRLMPVTMSLFGIMNWVYMWFRDGGPISREDFSELATAMVLDGVRGLR